MEKAIIEACIDSLKKMITEEKKELDDGWPKGLNHYQILDVDPKADFETIRKAYLRASLRYHPDKAKEEDKGKFPRVQQAYETLGEPRRRKEYDISISLTSPSRDKDDEKASQEKMYAPAFGPPYTYRIESYSKEFQEWMGKLPKFSAYGYDYKFEEARFAYFSSGVYNFKTLEEFIQALYSVGVPNDRPKAVDLECSKRKLNELLPLHSSPKAEKKPATYLALEDVSSAAAGGAGSADTSFDNSQMLLQQVLNLMCCIGVAGVETVLHYRPTIVRELITNLDDLLRALRTISYGQAKFIMALGEDHLSVMLRDLEFPWQLGMLLKKLNYIDAEKILKLCEDKFPSLVLNSKELIDLLAELGPTKSLQVLMHCWNKLSFLNSGTHSGAKLLELLNAKSTKDYYSGSDDYDERLLSLLSRSTAAMHLIGETIPLLGSTAESTSIDSLEIFLKIIKTPEDLSVLFVTSRPDQQLDLLATRWEILSPIIASIREEKDFVALFKNMSPAAQSLFLQRIMQPEEALIIPSLDLSAETSLVPRAAAGGAGSALVPKAAGGGAAAGGAGTALILRATGVGAVGGVGAALVPRATGGGAAGGVGAALVPRATGGGAAAAAGGASLSSIHLLSNRASLVSWLPQALSATLTKTRELSLLLACLKPSAQKEVLASFLALTGDETGVEKAIVAKLNEKKPYTSRLKPISLIEIYGLALAYRDTLPEASSAARFFGVGIAAKKQLLNKIINVMEVSSDLPESSQRAIFADPVLGALYGRFKESIATEFSAVDEQYAAKNSFR
jgi:hypothetical protein